MFGVYLRGYGVIVGELGWRLKDGKGGVSRWIKERMGGGVGYVGGWR